MISVNSSNIDSVGYDAEKMHLTIKFKGKKGHDGLSYIYKGVTGEKYESFLNADSIGKHFHQNIKGKYDTEKL